MTVRGRYKPRRRWTPRVPSGVLAVATLILTGLLGIGSPSIHGTAAPLARASTSPPPHVLLIVEENRSYSNIIGSVYAPYLTSLAKTYASATNWYSVQHMSQVDYLELIAGSSLGLPVGKPYSTTTLVDELHAAGIPWKSYMENLPSPCFKGTVTNGLYDVFHNPFHYFTRYTANTGGWCNSADLSTEGIVPYPGSSALVAALDATNAPDFVDLVPNDCNEMHGDKKAGSPCAGVLQHQLITAGDTWLSKNVGPVISSSWFKQNGIIIITWDESSSTDSSSCCSGVSTGGHIPTIVITSLNKGLGNFTSIGDHYGTLAGIEKAFGVPLLLNSANSINGNLSGAFG